MWLATLWRLVLTPRRKLAIFTKEFEVRMGRFTCRTKIRFLGPSTVLINLSELVGSLEPRIKLLKSRFGKSSKLVVLPMNYDERICFGPLAHREEQGTFNPKVPGSRPGRPTISR